MKTTVQIENLKCGGCASTITLEISRISSVEKVEVNETTSLVHITHTKDVLREIKEKLSHLGYPVTGDKNTVFHKAKSYVSCAVGRF